MVLEITKEHFLSIFNDEEDQTTLREHCGIYSRDQLQKIKKKMLKNEKDATNVYSKLKSVFRAAYLPCDYVNIGTRMKKIEPWDKFIKKKLIKDCNKQRTVKVATKETIVSSGKKRNKKYANLTPDEQMDISIFRHSTQ